MQAGLLLPARPHPFNAHRAGALPRRLRVPAGIVRAEAVPVRLQVPGRRGVEDRVPAALLLPEPAGDEPDAVPDRVQVRQARVVRSDGVPAGDVRVVRGQGHVRHVPGRPVLRDGDVVDAVPGWELLPARLLGAGAVPRRVVLRAGVVGADGLPGGDVVGGRGRVEDAVHVAAAAAGQSVRTSPRIICRRKPLPKGRCPGAY